MIPYQLPRCTFCRRLCIPLADYDLPVCVQCDAIAEGLRTAAERADALRNDERRRRLSGAA